MWCVYDKDDYEVQKAKELAAQHNFKVAFSRPCFEIWFLLHFTSSTRSYANAEELLKTLREHIKDYDKTNPPHATLLEKLAQAKRNAATLRNHNRTSNSHNPSTDVDRLIEAIEELKKSKIT